MFDAKEQFMGEQGERTKATYQSIQAEEKQVNENQAENSMPNYSVWMGQLAVLANMSLVWKTNRTRR